MRCPFFCIFLDRTGGLHLFRGGLVAHQGFKAIEDLFGARAARAVASGECEFGILLCGTGLGIGLAANKIKGIRCVTCSDPLSAELGRRHNNANMLSMGARIIGPELAKCIARAFLTAQFEGGRHALRVEMLSALERGEEIE